MHERSPQLRDVGVSNSLWQNGQRVLEEIGVLDNVLKYSTKIARTEVFDEKLQLLRLHEFNATDDRAIVVLRVYLHRMLVENARKAGVDILTGSPAKAAEPDGTLIMENGDRLKADLAIGCDGYHSNIRDSLGLAQEVGFVTDAAIGRVTVPREKPQSFETIQEYWAGSRRIGVLSCGPLYFLFLCAPENCPHNVEEVRTRSLNKPVWIAAFPHLEDKLERADSELLWGRYPIVRCKAWSVGHAVILGDSAHSMPPTLAQGAGCAMANALTLAQAVKDADDIPSALVKWEETVRPITETTQRWSSLYLTLSKRWPENILDMRSKLIRDAFTSPAVLSEFLAAAQYPISSH